MKTLLVLFLTVASSMATDWLPLWPNEAPGAVPLAKGTEQIGEGGRISHVEQPQYALYPAPEGKRSGQGVVIFPGGGYTILAAQHEGEDYAKWLNERGITAIVVKYRVSGNEKSSYGFPVPFLDARRAIRTMRANAEAWGVEKDQIGVMGSSAGGHLASLCATRFADTFEEEGNDEIDKHDCRPDFAVLIYPVISMDQVGHQGSRLRLIGKQPSAEMVDKMSTDRQVSAKTPPCFLLSTSDDGVDCRNSLMFATACREHKVPFALHLFEKGGHGYGLNGKGDLAAWPSLLEAWLTKRP
ncbi:alpha/beta hydrolase [Haloferula chungangensis]|uniref:Alpha/beta hydrolase n=1 Tax=Haloferula chungangensis TaxID=1048331 RepID=A0ABW2LAQ7_9BACT